MKVEGVKEWKVEKILNKKKMRGVEKYLVQWKGFTAEGDTWERRGNLKNAEEVLADFEGKMEIRKQEKIEETGDRDFRRDELLGKFTAKMLYRQNNGKFKDEYLKKLERNWQRWKIVSPEKKP